jgi:hypothetical protein
MPVCADACFLNTRCVLPGLARLMQRELAVIVCIVTHTGNTREGIYVV